MKFIQYKDGGNEVLGVLNHTGTKVLSLESLGYSQETLPAFIADYTHEVKADLAEKIKTENGLNYDTVILAAPITYPKHDILCAGMNYLKHAEESCRFKGIEYVPAKNPTYFNKRINKMVAPKGEIDSHSDITQKLDYEVELAVIIGKTCRNVAKEDVFEHIFGYTVVNDISARDLQNNHGGQYLFGKSLDNFCPMGPVVVTADEFAAPPHLRVQTRVNGEQRQDGNTADFIFDIPYMIAELSSGITLEPGDILITGTPEGVGMGFQPPRFLKAGDIVECEIEGIGVLRNIIK